MSIPPNQNKYDALLDQFMKIDDVREESDKKQMEQWLHQATNSVRGRFRHYRGLSTTDVIDAVNRIHVCSESEKQQSDDENDVRVLSNGKDHLATAMCLSLPEDSSGDDSLHEEEKVIKRSLFSMIISDTLVGSKTSA